MVLHACCNRHRSWWRASGRWRIEPGCPRRSEFGGGITVHSFIQNRRPQAALFVLVAAAIVAGLFVSSAGTEAANLERGDRFGRGAGRADCLKALARGSRLDLSLAELVADGTLTDTQANAV